MFRVFSAYIRLDLRAVETSSRCTSKHADRKSRPLQAKLAETERIRSWPNARNVNIGPQYHNVVLQLSCTGRTQNLIPCVTE